MQKNPYLCGTEIAALTSLNPDIRDCVAPTNSAESNCVDVDIEQIGSLAQLLLITACKG
jgi:hypothetical protein